MCAWGPTLVQWWVIHWILFAARCSIRMYKRRQWQPVAFSGPFALRGPKTVARRVPATDVSGSLVVGGVHGYTYTALLAINSGSNVYPAGPSHRSFWEYSPYLITYLLQLMSHLAQAVAL